MWLRCLGAAQQLGDALFQPLLERLDFRETVGDLLRGFDAKCIDTASGLPDHGLDLVVDLRPYSGLRRFDFTAHLSAQRSRHRLT